MPLFKFRVYWEDDDLIYRDIEILSAQNLFEFHTAIVKAYEFDGKHNAQFFESNERWERFRVFSSEVLSNKKNAPSLSMVKTPIGALINIPDQKFIYEYDPLKAWTFLIGLIGIGNETNELIAYPNCSRREGMAPSQYKVGGGSSLLMEVEEKYDLGSDEMAEGFGNEGGDDSGEESFGSEEDYAE